VRPARPNRRFNRALAIDRWVGGVLCVSLLGLRHLLGRRTDLPPPAPDRVRRVLVVKMWGLGSIVLASPVLREIRERYPHARVDFVSLRENESILRLVPGLGRLHLPDLGRGIPRFLLETAGCLWRIRRERYDLLLDLEFFTRFTAVFSLLAGAGRSHGFSSKGSFRGRLHDVEVPFNPYRHVTANFLALLRGMPFDQHLPFDRESPRALPPLEVPAEDWERCRRVLAAESAWDPQRATVVVNPNAGDMALERRWPAERVTELLDRLAARGDVNVVLTGSPGERPYVESLVASSRCPSRLVNLAGRVDIPEFVALLARARVVVTNDSGPLHLAGAAGTSSVALFGPETPVLYAPLRSREGQVHRVHYLGLPCSPCMFVHNNKVVSCWFAQARCMTGIAPGDVYADVAELLDGTAAEAATPRPALGVVD